MIYSSGSTSGVFVAFGFWDRGVSKLRIVELVEPAEWPAYNPYYLVERSGCWVSARDVTWLEPIE